MILPAILKHSSVVTAIRRSAVSISQVAKFSSDVEIVKPHQRLTRTDIANTLVKAHDDISHKKAEEIVQLVFSTIRESIQESRRVTIKNFGIFYPATMKARTYNLNLPAAKGEYNVPARTGMKFKQASTMRATLNK